ncbi:UPF0481 protein At3g47200-like [Aristolochia californica]|uniref:UPF0481 protein At3g47200-like n=1 Tax=Aristolochia californica TaxID=171875 RepID=UPI0035D8C7B0
MAENWVIEVEGKLEKVSSEEEKKLWQKHSIYKVPYCLKELHQKAYKPQVVSFGPYHYGDESLLPMEEHKQRALLHFFKRSEKTVEECWKDLEAVSDQLMDSYEGLAKEWKDKNRLLELMIRDGCFVLEILLTSYDVTNDYASNDPIFSSHGKLHNMPYIRRDMLMIENQIPFLVLERLFAIQSARYSMNEESLNKLILRFCTNHLHVPEVGRGLHVLDIYKKSMLQGPDHRPSSFPEEGTGELIRSAMELNEAGIRFKKSKTHSLKDISFHKGTLRLPEIVVDDTTESIFLNLMAYERLHVGAGNEVTSYVFFMDNIIDSAKDVSILHAKGIIQNAVGSDKAVAKLFNHLSKDATLDPESSLDVVHKQVNDYCKKRWNEWRANLIHEYFRSPWAFLSLLAAIYILILTAAQTFYSIYPYYKSKS